MKRVMLNLFLLAFVSSMMVACSKEEVAPFNSGSGSSSATIELKDGESNTTTQDGGSSSTVTDGVTTTTDEELDDESITDGGNSSDYDTKGSKKKKVN